MKTPEILPRILIKESIPENNKECCCICERKFIIVYRKKYNDMDIYKFK